MSMLKVYGLLAIGLGALALAGSVSLNVHQAKVLGQHRACVMAIKPNARLGADPRKLCDPAIAERWARAVQAETCDTALSAKPANAYGIGNNCSTPVKTLHAQYGVVAEELAGAVQALKDQKGDQVAAIRRAEADARVQAERKSRAAAAVQSAPRNADGLVICDARCLRARRANAPPDQRP